VNAHRTKDSQLALSYPQPVAVKASERERDSKTNRYVPLVWRVFGLNAAVLIAAVVLTVVILPPHVLAAPAAEEEIAVLLVSVCLMLAINLLLLRHAFAPLGRLTDLMREVDLLRPGQRVPVEASASEVMELGSTFNEMLDRLETERQERRRSCARCSGGGAPAGGPGAARRGWSEPDRRPTRSRKG
jgi:HAMP domain-containing protein